MFVVKYKIFQQPKFAYIAGNEGISNLKKN